MRREVERMKAMVEKQVTNEWLDGAIQSLEDCGEVLRKISETCCMPERSPKMKGMSAELQKARSEVQDGREKPEALLQCVETIAQCGSRIGILHVTCCTETREPLYQQILKGLNKAHEYLGKALRTGH